VVTDLLRDRLGFDGVIMTDDMGMGAIINNYTIGEAAVLAVLAGNDLLLTVETERFPDAMQNALLKAIITGRLSESQIDSSVRRLIRLKVAFNLAGAIAEPILPDKAEHEQLALDAGAMAVRIERDTAGWLELDLSDKRLTVVSPMKMNPGTEVNDGMSLLGERLAESGVLVTELFYDHRSPLSVADASARAIALAHSSDAYVVVMWDAILRYAQFQDMSQESLVNGLLGTGLPVIVVAGQLPYDSHRVPDAPTIIVTYGDTDGQIEGLVAILANTGSDQ
jgi:beta-N-acetylhexosaminidase